MMDAATYRFHTLLLRAAKMAVTAWEEWLDTKKPAARTT